MVSSYEEMFVLDHDFKSLQQTTGRNWSSSATWITIATTISLAILGALTFLVFKRKEMQPLKIMSP